MLIQKSMFKRNFEVSSKILWVFFLILELNTHDTNKKLDSSALGKFSISIKKYSDISNFNKFFSLINLDMCLFISTWNYSNLFGSLQYFLHIPFFTYNVGIRAEFLLNFKKYLNLLNIFFIPNFAFRKVDVVAYFNYSYSSNLYNIKLEVSNNIFFIYYEKYGFFSSYFLFLFFLNSLRVGAIYAYSYFIVTYSFIFQNIFYKYLSKFFLIKNEHSFGTSWSESRKRFSINFYSTIGDDDNSYVQHRLFSSYSSVRFTKLLDFSKKVGLSLPLKLVMFQHLRRMLICTNTFSFLIFLKTYIKDFKLLFLNLNTPTNEIFMHPSVDQSDKVICDISLTIKSFLSINAFMDKYKPYVKGLFLDCPTFNTKWAGFIKDFSKSLHYSDSFTNSNIHGEVLIRYYFDCNIIFILKKKILPLKRKKAQSLKRRRYKQIVKSAKRRFWIF